mmetsp:Transcript_6363/g.23528  ORF Transcript_6363/g.23528 Transcript_6363/m.23528 type:complete len:220 (-) Transcript_6363:408-1067(-)
MARPSATASTIVAKLSSARTMSEADRATAVPVPIAIPMSARFSAGASLTPSPVIATISPPFFKRSTSCALCAGSTRDIILTRFEHRSRSSSGRSSHSEPVIETALARPPRILSVPLLVSGSPGEFIITDVLASKAPICSHTDSAVALLSPVATMTRIPALRHTSRACLTSSLGGSTIPTMPMKVRSFSSDRLAVWVPGGNGLKAIARQRRVCSLPYFST